MKKLPILLGFNLIFLFLLQNPLKAEEWIVDTLSYDPEVEERFSFSQAVDTGPDNSYHFIYRHRDVNDSGGITTYYVKKTCEGQWTEPELVHPETEFTQNPTITVTRKNRVFAAYNQRNDPQHSGEGQKIVVAERTENGWETTQVPTPTDEQNLYPQITSDAQGNLHMVWIAQEPGEFDYTPYQIAYSTNLSGEWETQMIHECYIGASPHLQVSPEGTAHLVFKEINWEDSSYPYRTHYATNLQPGGEYWEVEILETPHAYDASGFIRVFNDVVHVVAGGSDSQEDLNHTYYFRKENNEWADPVRINQIDYGYPTGIDLNTQGQVFITYITQILQLPSGKLVLARKTGEDFSERVLMDAELPEFGMPEYNTFKIDDQDNLLLPNITRNYDQEYEAHFNSLFFSRSGECYDGEVFEVLFEIKNNHQEPVHEAVITFDGYTADPGQYLFADVEPGNYPYLVEKEGYYPKEGVAEVQDENLAIEIILEEASTGIDKTLASAITIFPNPANDWVEVNAADDLEVVEVFNLLGEVVRYYEPGSAQLRINTATLPTGIYILRIETDQNQISRKLKVTRN